MLVRILEVLWSRTSQDSTVWEAKQEDVVELGNAAEKYEARNPVVILGMRRSKKGLGNNRKWGDIGGGKDSKVRRYRMNVGDRTDGKRVRTCGQRVATYDEPRRSFGVVLPDPK